MSAIAGGIASWLVARVNIAGLPGLDQNNLKTGIAGALTWLLVSGLTWAGHSKWLTGHQIAMEADARVNAAAMAWRSPRLPLPRRPLPPAPPVATTNGNGNGHVADAEEAVNAMVVEDDATEPDEEMDEGLPSDDGGAGLRRRIPSPTRPTSRWACHEVLSARSRVHRRVRGLRRPPLPGLRRGVDDRLRPHRTGLPVDGHHQPRPRPRAPRPRRRQRRARGERPGPGVHAEPVRRARLVRVQLRPGHARAVAVAGPGAAPARHARRAAGDGALHPRRRAGAGRAGQRRAAEGAMFAHPGASGSAPAKGSPAGSGHLAHGEGAQALPRARPAAPDRGAHAGPAAPARPARGPAHHAAQADLEAGTAEPRGDGQGWDYRNRRQRYHSLLARTA